MRAYRLLLHAYPTSFRHEYGEAMCAIFERRRREAAGPVAAMVFWIGTIAEVLANAAITHGDILKQDLAYTMRVLRRAPGFAATAIGIVALGIGATTAAFTVTDFVLIRPLPFPAADRLVKVWVRQSSYRVELSPALYRDWKGASRSFNGFGAFHGLSVNLAGTGEPQRLEGSSVSADLFPTLGVRPLVGRGFTEADDRDGAPGTLLLSYRLWQTEFGGDPAAIGRRVVLDNESFEVVGVMPREFRFPNSDAMLWTPMRLAPANFEDRNDNWLQSVARLRHGVSLDQARAEMEVLAAQSRRQHPKDHEDTYASVIPLRDEMSRKSRLLLVALCGAAGCVLLIACSNLANLLLARALGRRKELAVRAALGAGRERLVRQLMTESLSLAGVGGAVGVVVAILAVPLLSRLVPSTLPIAQSPGVDLRVLAFAALVTALTGIVFGLVPLPRAGGETEFGGLREGQRAGGGRKEHLRSSLVVVEIVVSVVLLVSTGLLMRSLWSIQSTDPGFRSEGVLTLRTALPPSQYGKTARREEFYTRVLSDVRALPGVTHAAYVSFLPMAFVGGIWPVAIPGKPATRADDQLASLRYVTPGFFATLAIPLKRGRDVGEQDTGDRPFVAVVSESFARRYWPDEDPIGRHFDFALADRTVVGVVGDIRVRGLEQPSEPQVYLSYKQVPDNSIIGYIPKDLVVRSSTPPAALLPPIRAILREVDPVLPISDVRTLGEIVDRDTASRSAQARVLGAFAAIAVLLAGIGIHGLLSFAVSQRVHEIGVRIALGAQPVDIVSMVMRRSVLLAVVGVVPGIALAYAAGRAMEALLAGITPGDFVTFGTAVGLSVAMTVAGSLVPTLRALRVDPMTAIRAE
jgi:putative ABC transport system permease protein